MKPKRKCRRSIFRLRKKVGVTILPEDKLDEENSLALRAIGWASVALGVITLGVFVGRELRQRYKFNRRTPSDFYSHAGDEMRADYGMGI